MKLDGKVAIVTGAGRNIGEEIARTLAREGAKVVVVDIDLAAAERVVKEIGQAGGKALAVQADVSNSAQVRATVERTVREFGGVDIMVNNASITVNKSILETTEEEWDRCQAVTLKSQFLFGKLVAEQMIKQGRGGRIVNIASTSGHLGRRNALAYCAAKGGVLNLTRAMACDLAPYKIRVNSVTPTKTGSAVGFADGAEKRRFDEILLGRLGHPRDQANAVLFMVSDDSDFITGADIRVDGGSLATWGASWTS